MRLVLCHGTFDWLHWGHVAMFKEARELGDRLVVSMTADAYLNKGLGRPIFNQAVRADFIKELRCVDEVYICPEKSGLTAIRYWKPDFYVKGGDYLTGDKHGALNMERVEVEKHGGELVILDRLPHYSSSDIIRRLRETL